MTIKYHTEADGSPLIQGSDAWAQARCGLLTASEMKLIITPTLKIASNDKERAHLYELLAQRITSYVEPHYIGDDMLRGIEEEIYARATYAEHYAAVEEVGFITNDKWGFTIGYSPDGVVGFDGLVECKSRRGKYQIQTIVENLGIDQGETIPPDFLMQLQTGLLVSERDWIDFVSYSGGLPMVVIRCRPDCKVQNAIVEAAGEFERRLADKLTIYNKASRSLIKTERRVEQEII
jgi:YqaJ-like recombinase protein